MQTLFKSIITYIQNFVYPWHVPRYIHNTILKLFTKPRSWTFHTILNASLLQMVSNFQSDLTVYLTLYFKHIQHIQIPGLFRHVILQQGIFSHIHNIRHIETYLPAFGYISEDSGIFKILAQKYSCILRHIQNPWLIQLYLEPQRYLAGFRQVIQVLFQSNLCIF